MSLPETCPFCGCFGELRNGDRWVGFTCMTTIHAGQDARRTQSRTCEGLERTRLLDRLASLERELEQAKEDRARAAMDARNPMLARLAELEAENKALRERLAQSDAEQHGSRVALRAACEAVDRFADRIAAMRNAGNALARHVADDNRGQTARALVQAWEEAAR